MTFAPAGSVTDLAPGAMKGVEVDGQKLLLANVDGTFYAIQRKCPHMGFDLCKGTLHDGQVTCRMHGATFDLKTGEAMEKAKVLFLKTQPKPARTYSVKVEDGQMMIEVSTRSSPPK